VNTADLDRLRTAYNKVAGAPGFTSRFDINGDGRIDIADLTLVAAFNGKTCS
jgi:hypothetical protein